MSRVMNRLITSIYVSDIEVSYLAHGPAATANEGHIFCCTQDSTVHCNQGGHEPVDIQRRFSFTHTHTHTGCMHTDTWAKKFHATSLVRYVKIVVSHS